MKLRRRKMLQETAELNITAFLNLMVILVPFLLITAVFSRMTVLELNLPGLGESAAGDEAPVKLELQLLLYPDNLQLRDANMGRIREFAIEDETINWRPIVEVLLEIKRRFPEEQEIALLLDRAVPYRLLIEVMDHVRSAQIVNFAALEEVELFPSVSVGDAPPAGEQPDEDVSLDALPGAQIPAEDGEETTDAN